MILKDKGLDYRLCGYPGTRLRFRGPALDAHDPSITFLGGTETFGKYVRNPFPGLVSDWTGLPVRNLGVAHAGISLLSGESWLLETASASRLTVLQILGAQNMSNRLYNVHPRRNDRFIAASPALREMYPQVDFTEIHFTGHLLDTLARRSPSSFSHLVDELRAAWVGRMRKIVDAIRGEVLLLWISDREPEARRPAEPLFVNRDMLNQLTADNIGLVEVVLPGDGSLEGKIVPEDETRAARHMPGPADHARIAEALVGKMSQMGVFPGHASGAARDDDYSFSISSGTAVNRSATRP